jgi:hypothetical protein
MKGRQFYEISRNVLALYAIAGPIQAQLKQLAAQEADLRRNFESIKSRIKSQEVSVWVPVGGRVTVSACYPARFLLRAALAVASCSIIHERLLAT